MANPKADLLQGTLDMLSLKALSLGPLHGYGIIQRIRQLFEELLESSKALSNRRSTGPRQRVLDQFQMGSDRDRPPGKFYTLTIAGSKQLKAEEEGWIGSPRP